MKAVYNNAGVKVPGMYEKGGATETKKDSCYYKAKAAHKVFPSAYASGMIAKCRKKKARK
tara:strand:+ start:824 stop:1003 length:180 start_codon:yes stop_codon:yes gene_type:complete